MYISRRSAKADVQFDSSGPRIATLGGMGGVRRFDTDSRRSTKADFLHSPQTMMMTIAKMTRRNVKSASSTQEVAEGESEHSRKMVPAR